MEKSYLRSKDPLLTTEKQIKATNKKQAKHIKALND